MPEPPDVEPEIPALYDVARRICHEHGLPWTDPRTGVTYPPPAPPLKVVGIPVRLDATLCAPDEVWIEGPTGDAVRVWPPTRVS